MYVDEFGLTLGAPLATIVLEITDQFLALSVDRDDRLSSAEEVDRLRVDVTKLCVAIDVVAAFPCLAVCLQAVVHPAQQIANNRRENLVPILPQLFGEMTQAPADPQEHSHGIASRRGLYWRLQVAQQRWILNGIGSASA